MKGLTILALSVLSPPTTSVSLPLTLSLSTSHNLPPTGDTKDERTHGEIQGNPGEPRGCSYQQRGGREDKERGNRDLWSVGAHTWTCIPLTDHHSLLSDNIYMVLIEHKLEGKNEATGCKVQRFAKRHWGKLCVLLNIGFLTLSSEWVGRYLITMSHLS